MKIGIFGNCQTTTYADIFKRKLPDFTFLPLTSDEDASELSSCDLIFQQNDYWHSPGYLAEIKSENRIPIIKIPTFYFPGFHPDLVIEHLPNRGALQSPAGSYNSSIVIYGYLKGLSISQTLRLFDDNVFERLGFYGYFGQSQAHLENNFNDCGLDGKTLFNKLRDRGCFAYSVNHFTPEAAEIIVDAMIEKLGYSAATATSPVTDLMRIHGRWPVYPPIAERLGFAGDYEFRFGPLDQESGERGAIDLSRFVEHSFESYKNIPEGELVSQRLLRDASYNGIEFVGRRRKSRPSHVYSDLPETSYWKKSVSERSSEEVDPVTAPRFTFNVNDKIATAGSCFAQHIARTLVAQGYSYHIVETPPPGKSKEWADARSYGLFSARYGNIYTARQLRQLVDRSLGEFTPEDTAWMRPDGRYIDPFRPQLEPDGYATRSDVEHAASIHLGLVRELFETTDVLVFTLGLTESWASKKDGAVFPVAPGVFGGEMDFERYEFRNFRVNQVIEDLTAAVIALRDINPKIKIVLTVSPVPLVATYENRHVLVSTVYSKSVLRTAVEEVRERFSFVEYFPSYEIITGNHSMGRYFEDDKRSVNPAGVARVMKLLTRHYLETTLAKPARGVELDAEVGQPASALMQEIANNSTILCDEEALEQQPS